MWWCNKLKQTNKIHMHTIEILEESNKNLLANIQELEEFNKNLFRDVNDLYEKENSQRTYYSTPSTTIPNDQKSFAEWCYGIPETCKTNQQKCLVYDDLRYSRRESPYEYVL